jgi:hypothetical protein
MARIHTPAEANAFLRRFIPRYNTRFAKPAAHPQPVYRPWPNALDPDTVFCFKYLRTVANDHTLALGPHLLQIVPNGRSRAKARVEVHERLDGTMAVFYHGQALAVQRLTAPPKTLRTYSVERVDPAVIRRPRIEHRKAPPSVKPRRQPWTPPSDHPWRQYEKVQRWKATRRRIRTESLIT